MHTSSPASQPTPLAIHFPLGRQKEDVRGGLVRLRWEETLSSCFSRRLAECRRTQPGSPPPPKPLCTGVMILLLAAAQRRPADTEAASLWSQGDARRSREERNKIAVPRLALVHSGPLWSTLVHSGSLWFKLALVMCPWLRSSNVPFFVQRPTSIFKISYVSPCSKTLSPVAACRDGCDIQGGGGRAR